MSAGETVRPGSVGELADALRGAAAAGAAVAVHGAGTKATWGGLGPAADVVIDTTGLDTIVEHAAGDLVATVQAGVRLADLQRAAGAAHQWLALDPPEDGATVGGVVATAASGPRRLRFGTPRDLLIGVTVVLADGTVARSGGKVVKNVAGYDLGKLFTGSFGTLGVIAECTFRLHPVAPARRVVRVATTDPAPLVRDLLRSPLVPSAIEWSPDALAVVVESTEAGASAQAAQAVALLGAGDVTDAVPAGFARRPWGRGDVALKLTHRISAFGRVLDVVRRELPAAHVTAHAGSGVLYAGLPVDGAAATADVAAAVEALRAAVAADDGSVVVVDAPVDVKRAVDVWGPVRGLDLMRRVKLQFDPDGRMNPGRFVGGI